MTPIELKMISLPKSAVFLALILISSAAAQVAPSDASQSPPAQAGTTAATPDFSTVTTVTSSAAPVRLSPFEVSADSNTGYGASSTKSAARVAQNYIDVPQTVNVITSQFIDDYNLRDARELFNWIPNLIEPQDGNPNYQLRGLNVGYL